MRSRARSASEFEACLAATCYFAAELVGTIERHWVRDRFLSTLSRMYLALPRQPRLVVATFHRVEGDSRVRRAQVRHHLEFLANHFDVVTPSQLAHRSPVKRTAIITIDDCHADVFEHIYPVAKSLQIPITLCAPTDFLLRNNWLWFDKFEWMIRHLPPDAHVEILGRTYDLSVESAAGLVRHHLKYSLPAEREASLSSIEEQLQLQVGPSPTSEYQPVSENDMRVMLRSGYVELCAHTLSHTIATVLPDADLERELADSKRELEAISGREVASFCYPNGAEGDFDDRTTAAVRRAGYKMAFTTVEGTQAMKHADLFRLRRVHAHRRTAVFEKLTTGLGDRQHALTSSCGLD